MKQARLLLALAVVALLGAAQAWAQGVPTATLSGKAINEGVGLPGVLVTISSPSLQGVRTRVTTTNGDYTFVGLPAGSYTVKFELSGFQPVVRKIDLAAAQSYTVNGTLSMAAVTAAATVVAQAENISESTQSSTTMTNDTLSKLPTGRTLLSAVTLAPSVNTNGPNGAVTISGGTSYDNLFLVNGANIQDNIRGTPLNLFVEDAIQETTTSTSGISAEFGRFSGGVVNTITKSGGNSFSGSFRTNFSNAAWSATPTLGTDGAQKLNEIYEATFGGPIWKDRVWFFASGRYGKTDNTTNTQSTLIPVNQTNEDKRYEGKLTITPFQNHTIMASYLNWTRDQGNYYFNPLPAYDLAQFYDRQLPSDFFVGNYNGVLTSSFFVEAQYSQKHFTFENSGGRFTDLVGGTPVLDASNGAAVANSPIFCAVCPGSAEKRDNQDFYLKGTYFLSTSSLGSHNIVVGYDQFRGHHLSNNYQSGSQYIVTADAAIIQGQTVYPVFTPGAAYFGYWPIFAQAIPSNLKTQSAFLNDAWKLNNSISFNLGVRYDKNSAKDMAGVLRQDDDAWSPRLGVTVDPTGGGKLRFNASYARYVSAVQENFAGGASSAGNPSYFYYFYDGPGINTGSGPYVDMATALKQFFGWWGITQANMFPTANQDTLYAAGYQGLNTQIAPGMQSPHTDEFSVGVAGNVGSRLTYRADATYRKGAGFIETLTDMSTGQVDDPLGNTYDVHVTRNGGSEYKREYYGLALQFGWRPFDGLNLGGNWTWSHTYGNLIGETSGSGPVTGGLNNYPEYIRASWGSPVGELPQDQRHRVRVWGAYDIPVPKAFGNVNVSGVFQANSGLPYSAAGSINVSNYVTNPGYATPPTSQTYYFGGRGEFTTEAWYQLDLALNYSYPLGPVELFVQPQVLNVLGAEHLNGFNLNTTVYTARNSGRGLTAFDPFTTASTALVECPQGASASACAALGANWQKGPSFGRAANFSAYQQPRTFLVSVGLRF